MLVIVQVGCSSCPACRWRREALQGLCLAQAWTRQRKCLQGDVWHKHGPQAKVTQMTCCPTSKKVGHATRLHHAGRAGNATQRRGGAQRQV